MNRILGTVLLVAFLGLLFISLACGGSGYEGDDPKNQPARDAVGIPPVEPDEGAAPPGAPVPPPDAETPAPEGGK
jgi:hypothetical protein